jgi:hypothetical protein
MDGCSREGDVTDSAARSADTSLLEQVLSDSEILTECKWGNQKLLNL